MLSNVNRKSFTAFGRGWARIWGKCRGGIWLLPSEATAAIVQYYPQLRISAVLPAKTRTVYADYYRKSTNSNPFELSTPPLLWSHLLYQRVSSCYAPGTCWCSACQPDLRKHHLHCYCAPCLEKKRDHLEKRGKTTLHLNHFSLFEYQESGNNIFAYPFRIANIDSSGKVCFGNNFPVNLRRANSLFWAAPFNNDYNYHKPSHTQCLAKKHYYNGLHFSGQHATNGTTGANCRREQRHPCNCPRKKENIHLVDCSCYRGCLCPCECLCCKAACQCKCSCFCCRGVCNCDCTCNLNEDFIQLLKNSVEKRRPAGYDHTNTFCGQKFIATNKPVDGVFISFDPDLVSECKSSICELGDAGGGLKKCLIGFASRSADGQWIVDLQQETLALEDTEVYVL